MAQERQTKTVLALGTAQTLAWASSYYIPAVLAMPMARDLNVSVTTIFAAFSAALIVSALLGPLAGRTIDRWGGQWVLAGTNVLFALGLVSLGFANDINGLFAAWLILGIAMGSGLYEAAFSALVRLYGTASRSAITGITLLAGFASTVGWPISSLLEGQMGWRGACFVWAGFHLLIGLPLNLSIPKVSFSAPIDKTVVPSGDKTYATATMRPVVVLAFVFAITGFISTALAAHLPQMLQIGGLTLAGAVAVGALVGPAQVAGRLLEFGFLRRVHPLFSARLASLMHPIGATALALMGSPVAVVFAVLHGTGNGILTIAKGTLPLVLFGPHGYGARQGLLMVPARIAQAIAPWVFAICLDRWGAGALWLSASLGLAAFAALLFFPKTQSSQSEKFVASTASG